LGHVSGKPYAQKISKLVSDLKPDMVFIGGDLFDGAKMDEVDVISPLSKIKPVQGMYFVTGNHDGFYDSSEFKNLQVVTNAGIRVLNNEVVNVEGLQIVGVDYRQTTDPVRFAEILRNLNIVPNLPSILLKHVPTYIEVAESAKISLQISGHTHRVQVWPLSYIGTKIFKGFDYGLKNSGNTQIYTSSGTGTWGPPYRVGTNCEIVVIELV
jgi:predicted MPP superfamily phosphohydrolase